MITAIAEVNLRFTIVIVCSELRIVPAKHPRSGIHALLDDITVIAVTVIIINPPAHAWRITWDASSIDALTSMI